MRLKGVEIGDHVLIRFRSHAAVIRVVVMLYDEPTRLTAMDFDVMRFLPALGPRFTVPTERRLCARTCVRFFCHDRFLVRKTDYFLMSFPRAPLTCAGVPVTLTLAFMVAGFVLDFLTVMYFS
jgi:hypothetical protein